MHWVVTEAQGYYELAQISSLPTALLYGYSVYTSFQWPLEEQWLDAHLQRLVQNSAFMNISFSWDTEGLKSCIARYQNPDQPVIRLTVSPEIASFRSLLVPNVPPLPTQSLLLVSFTSLPAKSTHPLKLKTVAYQDPLSQIKHGALAPRLFLRHKAVLEGFDDILLVNNSGTVSEASTSNIFFIKDKTLHTPEPKRDACLSGITRQRILEFAKYQGIQVSDATIKTEQLNSMDGAFICNAVLGIQKLEAINDIKFPWPESSKYLFHKIDTGL